MPSLQNSLDIEAINHKKIANPSDTPPAGYVYLYVDSNGDIYKRDENGVDSQIGGSSTALATTTDTTNFDTILSVSESDVQKALDILDDHTHTEASITDLDHDAVKLQGRTVVATAPNDTDYLGWNNGSAQWEPKTFTSGGGYPFNVITVDATDADADYSTISAAITAASANDVILIGPGTYNETLTVNKEINLAGINNEECIITSSSTNVITVSVDNATLKNLSVVNTATTGSIACVYVSAQFATLENLILNPEVSGPTNSYGIHADSVLGTGPPYGVIIKNCDVVRGTRAVYTENNVTVRIYGGNFGAGVEATGTSNIHLYGVPSISGYHYGSGVIGAYNYSSLYLEFAGYAAIEMGDSNYYVYDGITYPSPGLNVLSGSGNANLAITEYDVSQYHVMSQGSSNADVSNPPTAAELAAAFPNAAAGFTGIVNDAGANTTGWLVSYDGTNWWYQAMTKAV